MARELDPYLERVEAAFGNDEELRAIDAEAKANLPAPLYDLVALRVEEYRGTMASMRRPAPADD